MKLKSKEILDEIDLKIIKLLQEDCRLSFSKVAVHLGISVGTAYNRIKSMEERGIIKGYTVIADPLKLDLSMTAIILIQAEGAHLIQVENQIAEMDNVISVYDITGDYDMSVIVRFKDRVDLNEFVKKLLSIPHVMRTVTNVVLNIVKEDFRINIP